MRRILKQVVNIFLPTLVEESIVEGCIKTMGVVTVWHLEYNGLSQRQNRHLWPPLTMPLVHEKESDGKDIVMSF